MDVVGRTRCAIIKRWASEQMKTFSYYYLITPQAPGCSSNEREWIPIECMFDLGFINACSSTTCGSLLIGFTVSFHMRSCVLTTHFLSIFLLYLFFKFSNIIFIYGVYKMRMNHLNTFVRRFLNILLSTVEF